MSDFLNEPPIKIPDDWVVGEKFTIPDEIEPIVAWRSWNLNAKQDRLLSCSGGSEVWEPGKPMVATCRRHGRRGHVYPTLVEDALAETELLDLLPKPEYYTIPVESCSCGIYAAVSRDHAMSYGEINGEVYLWGKVIRGEKAHRAQFAYPKTLYWTEPPSIIDFLNLDPNMRATVQSAIDLIGVKEAAKQPWMTWGHGYTHKLECYGVPIIYDE